jgi:hypothetical protein
MLPNTAGRPTPYLRHKTSSGREKHEHEGPPLLATVQQTLFRVAAARAPWSHVCVCVMVRARWGVGRGCACVRVGLGSRGAVGGVWVGVCVCGGGGRFQNSKPEERGRTSLCHGKAMHDCRRDATAFRCTGLSGRKLTWRAHLQHQGRRAHSHHSHVGCIRGGALDGGLRDQSRHALVALARKGDYGRPHHHCSCKQQTPHTMTRSGKRQS